MFPCMCIFEVKNVTKSCIKRLQILTNSLCVSFIAKQYNQYLGAHLADFKNSEMKQIINQASELLLKVLLRPRKEIKRTPV